jgi:hypothetical protein
MMSEPAAIRARTSILALAIFLALAVALQWASGAFQSEFGHYADEPAHYVTSLMIHDWAAHGFPMPPMEFAKEYYFHYPKVAFGEWPPLFHFIQATWMLVFSPARASVLLFMASITALLTLTLYRAMLKEFSSVIAAFAAGAVLICLPAVQVVTNSDMADMLVALLDLWAILSLIRYLERDRTQDALWFGLWTGLSIMTKQNGAALAVATLLTIALTRRWNVLFRPPLWYAAGVAILIAGPWEYFVWQVFRRNLVIQTRSPGFGTLVFLQYCVQLASAAGGAVLIAAALGVWDTVVSRWSSRKVEVRWAAWTALPVGVVVFHSFLPGAIAEPRYLIAGFPGLIMLAAAGIKWLAAKLPSGLSEWQRSWLAGGVGLILCAAQVFSIPQKPSFSLRQASADLLRTADPGDMFMVSSQDGAREGAFVAEVAMHDSRPGHVVLRAGKLLAISNWMNDHYALVYATPEQVEAYLISLPISAIVLDGRTELLPHHKLLREVVRQFPDSWTLMASYPDTEVYQRVGPRPAVTGTIRLNMQYTLGYTLDRQ